MADRSERIRIFEETLALCGIDESMKETVAGSVRGQRIVWADDALAPAAPVYAEDAEIVLSEKRTVAAALDCPEEKVCILNFASSVTPGGGVSRGSSAQEESICRVTTLYPALTAPNAMPFYEEHRRKIRSGEMSRANSDDLIYTPGVAAVREDDFDCALLPVERRKLLDVITCAAPDLRDYFFRITEKELSAILRRRIGRILDAAADAGAEVLILGAFGCGVFGNPPELVAEAFSLELAPRIRCFRRVEFAVYCSSYDDDNYTAFRKYFGR